jgi:hypothetical protein
MSIAADIAPHLAGLGPEMQGAVLAELTAKWIAGFRGDGAPEFRAGLLDHWLGTVKLLVKLQDDEPHA